MKLRKYSVEFKLECLNLASIIGYGQASKLIGIDRKSLREWVINKEKFEKIKLKEKTYRLPGGGAKPKNPEKEEKVYQFVIRCKEIGIPINTRLIIDELCRLDPEMKKKSRRTLRKWCYRFLKRKHFNQFKDE